MSNTQAASNFLDFDYYLTDHDILLEISTVENYLNQLNIAISALKTSPLVVENKQYLLNSIIELKKICIILNSNHQKIISQQTNLVEVQHHQIKKIDGVVCSQISNILICLSAKLGFINTVVNQFNLYIEE